MSEWRQTRLDALARPVNEVVDPRQLGSELVDHFSIPALDATGGPATEPASAIESNKQPLVGGEVLVSKLNPRKARVLSVPVEAERRMICSGEFIVLRPLGRSDKRFLEYLMLAESTRQLLDASVQSVTRSHQRVRPDVLTKLKVCVPSREEQRVIAEYLDAETARIDALITKKRRMIELLGEQVDAQVFAAVSGSLTAGSTPRKHTQIPWLDTIPSHWGSPWLGANHTTQLGKMLSASVASGPEQYPYVKNTNVQWDRFDLTDLPTMTFDASDRVRCNLDEGDLLVCEGGEVGRAAVWPGAPKDVFFQKAIHRVRPVSEAEPRYTMYCLWAAANMNVFAVEGNQATIVHLTGEKLREHRFPWPPLAEQREIVRRLDESGAKVEGMVERLTKQIDLLTERRQALITAAVTGELGIPGLAA